MAQKDGVLEIKEGAEYLTFPGPGGYEIVWQPGAVRIKLEKAPSGHLVIPTDSFDEVPKKPSTIPEKEMVLQDH